MGIVVKYEALMEKNYGHIQRLKAPFQVCEGATAHLPESNTTSI